MHIDDFGRGTPVIFQNGPGVKGRGDKPGVPRGEPFVRNERMAVQDGQFQDPDRAIGPEPARMSPASACPRTATSSWPVAGRLARRRASASGRPGCAPVFSGTTFVCHFTPAVSCRAAGGAPIIPNPARIGKYFNGLVSGPLL